MMFRCISNFEIDQDEITPSDRVYTREERQAIEETREAELQLETQDAISEDEEELTGGTHPIIQIVSERAPRKRQKSTASISDIEDDDEIPLPPIQEGNETQLRMATRNRGQKRPRREDDDFVSY